MKKGKIVLGVAAAVVTVSGALAFKANHKYNVHLVYGVTTINRVKCKLCASLWVNVNADNHAKTCYTAAGGANPGVVITLTGNGINHQTWYTASIHGVCVNAITKVTTTP